MLDFSITGLMVTGSSHKQLLIRQGDWFLGQPEKIFDDDSQLILHHFRNLTVMESYPVKQGYMHSNTEVIITLSKQASRFYLSWGQLSVFEMCAKIHRPISLGKPLRRW